MIFYGEKKDNRQGPHFGPEWDGQSRAVSENY